MWRLVFLLVWTLTLVGCSGLAPTLDNARAEQLSADIQAALDSFEITGAAFTLVWPDGAYTAGFGHTDRISGASVTTDSRFAVASAIKPFAVSWMAAQLHTHQLSWETPLSALWPTFALGAAGDVTVRQAVHQTSGYPRDDWAWIGRDLSVEDLVAVIRPVEPVAPVGRIFTYHNILFALALRGVEARVGEIFPVFAPDVMGYDRRLDGQYRALSQSAHQTGEMSVVLEAGLSASDAVPMLRALLSDAEIYASETVNAAGAACCPLGADVRYGRGMFVEQYAGVTVWLHDGDGVGYTSVVMLDPAAQIGLFIAVNQGGADEFIHAARYHILEKIYGFESSGMAAMQTRWSREMVAQANLARRGILSPEIDRLFTGDYQGDVRLTWDVTEGLSLHRGGFAWRLRSMAAGYVVFDHGPLIGQPLDLVCAEGQRRIVSGGTVLGIGDKC